MLGAPYAVPVDSLSFLASALFVMRIRKPEERPARATPEQRTSIWTELKEGIRFVLGKPNLRAQAGCTAHLRVLFNVTWAVLLLYFVRVLELSPSVIGIVFSVVGIGSLVGAFVADGHGGSASAATIAVCALPGRLPRHRAGAGRLPRSRSLRGGIALGFVIVVYNIVQVSYRQAICPLRLQGRMNSVMRFIVWGAIPLGVLTGGALGTWLGLRETLVIGAIGGALSFLLSVLAAAHLLEMPERWTTPSRCRGRVVATGECPSYPRWRPGCGSSTLVGAAVEKPGPAHVATLKTFDPPLRELEGRRFSGAVRRAKRLLFPTDDGELVLRCT